jgi:asparagine synthase (glutamine-hydrolysing)
LGGFFQAPSTIRNAYLAFRGIFTRRTARLLAAQFAGVPISQFMVHSSEKVQPTMMPNPSDEVSHCELTLYMRNQLLRDSDVMSMKNSLELRVPFVDRVLFETVSRIPAAVRLQQGKKLLLEAVPEIPDWIKNQPKRGFLFPYETWAKSTWGDVFLETNRRLPIPNPTWYQQWCIFVLHFWLKRRGFEPESR